MLKLVANKVNLQPQFIVNLLLIVYIVTLKVFYLLFINLLWYTPYFRDVFIFGRIGKNFTELTSLFRKMVTMNTILTSALRSSWIISTLLRKTY